MFLPKSRHEFTSRFVSHSYHLDQPNELNAFVLQLLQCPSILPHFLLITPEQLQDGTLRSRLQEIYKAGCLARFVIDEADKFLGVRQGLHFLLDIVSDYLVDYSGENHSVSL